MPPRLPLSTRAFSSASGSKSPAALVAALRRNAPVDVHSEVLDALAHGRPVVALETALITHGMPRPTNLETARSSERIVRTTGAVPATIGLVAGRMKIGMTSAELERLADVEGNPGMVKVSRRDIGPAMAMKKDGGTTICGTLIFAALAGIKVFATGGLGGVHRGGENSMDVSADLHELTRCPVALVSGGIKSILDIGRTLEYLETLGVPVLAYGPTNDFPAFFTRISGCKTPWRTDDPQVAARILRTHWQLGMTNGALFAAPVPAAHEATGVQASIEQAVREADENGVSKLGKDATPWLLQRVSELTKGSSLASNVALINNTALVGGQIAVEYAKLEREFGERADVNTSQPRLPDAPAYRAGSTDVSMVVDAPEMPPAKLVVVGSAAIDITAQMSSSTSLGKHSTTPGSIAISLGGVGRNIAEAAHRILSSLPASPASALLVSSHGPDAFGRLLVEETHRIGMRADGLQEIVDAENRTAVCNMLLNDAGSLTGGVADMDIVEQCLTGDVVVKHLEKHQPAIVAVDANLTHSAIADVLRHCLAKQIPVLFEPTSIIKSTRILPGIASAIAAGHVDSPLTFATPNLLELQHMYEYAQSDPLAMTAHPAWWRTIDAFALGSAWRMGLEQLARRPACDADIGKGSLAFLVESGVAQMAINLLPLVRHLVIKCGERGVLVAMRLSGADASGASGWAREPRSNPLKRFVLARGESEMVVLQHFPALVVPSESIVNVTGAGDSFVGSVLASLVQSPRAFLDPPLLAQVINKAQRSAVLTLQSRHAVSPLLSAGQTA